MQHSTGKPTKEEQLRFEAIKEVGCLCCLLDGVREVPCEINHIVKGRKRLGHLFSYGLCEYHHRNIPPCDGLGHGEAEERWGPSLAASPAAFKAEYGTDAELLEIQNALIEPILQSWASEFT